MWNFAIRARRGKAPVDMPRPGLLIISAPKSGTVYLNTVLQRTLVLENTSLCNGYFPHDHLSLERLHDFAARDGRIASSHLDPSPGNLNLLRALLPRWIVHLRDPRACLLSWVHHVRRLHHEGRHLLLLRVTPTPPPAVLEASLLDCIEWHIGRFYEPLVAWTEAWVNVARAEPDRILLTEYAALHADEGALCQQMAAFVGYAPERYRHQTAARTMETHYRVGELAEWRRVFTPDQIRRTTAILPPALCRRFGWPYRTDAAPADQRAPCDSQSARVRVAD